VEALGESAQGDLATKADLVAAKSELKTEIAGTNTDLLKWIIGAIGFQTVVIPSAVVSLAGVFAK
jgi:hypothetical protein